MVQWGEEFYFLFIMRSVWAGGRDLVLSLLLYPSYFLPFHNFFDLKKNGRFHVIWHSRARIIAIN